MSNSVVKSKRFVIRKNGIKNNVTIEFTNKKGETFVYNQKVVFEQLKDRFESMNCFNKYGNYTNSNNLPKFVRELDKLV